MNRQSRALLSVVLVGGVIAITSWRSCARDQDENAGEIVVSEVATRGGTLTASLRSEPRTFNRLIDQNFPVDLYSVLTGAKLIRVNRATRALESGLAERWTASPDNLTYTLTLRDGMTWSDGTPLTSADVIFTFQAIYHPGVQSVLDTTLRVSGQPLRVTAPDARTVVITFPGTFGPGIAILDHVPIQPKHKLQAALDGGTFRQALAVTTPPSELVVAGPFMLRSYVPGQRFVFDRNPRYWKKDVTGIQLPYADQVILEVVADQNAELVRLQAGQIDMPQQPIRPEDVATLRPLADQGRIRIIELGVAADPDLFFFNLNSAYWAKDRRRDWMLTKEFRRAISHAVDREAYANTVYLGAGVPIWGPITPGNKEWFSPNVMRYGYSIDRAREIFGQLGLVNRDADEWLEDRNNTEARFTVLTFRGNSSLERGTAVLRDSLKAAGVAVDVVPMEAGSVVQRMQKGDFDSIMFGLTASSFDPSLNPDFWLSSGSAHIWNIGQKVPATAWEKEIDDLMRQVTAKTDPAERKRLFDQVQTIFADNLPVLYFVAPRLHMAVSSRIGNLEPAINRPQLLWNVEKITVRSDQERR
ncbi:MAG TPA: ABC transporter substrate-binding protein [Vicinamibacterales bacterium]|nr:ABC transporter substrate-binding protein [Vicinamibacterales bacterium]